MIEPALKDDAFVLNVQDALKLPGLHLWWLGQSGFLVSYDGHCLLLDPYLSDSLTHKYAATAKPHVRMTKRVIDPQRLNFILAVSSSHNHTDHLDADTLKPLLSVNPALRLIIPETNRQFVAQRLNIAPDLPIGVDDGQSAQVGPFTLTAVPAAHETIERDSAGRCHFLGYVVHVGSWVIYHSGDTILYDGMVERLRQWKIDLALLPINGRDPKRGVAGNLSGPEAAALAHDIGARCVIPCHYEMFEFNTASPQPFIEECQRLGQPYAVLRAGARFTLPASAGEPQDTPGQGPPRMPQE